MKTRRLLWAIAATAVVLAIAALALWLLRPGVPASVMKPVDFVVLYPKGEGIEIDVDTYKYDTKLAQLSFIVHFQGRSITFAEQATPSQFSDIPDYYPKLMEKMNTYESFENTTGKVHLTRPTEVKHQVGVINAKGTLVFAQSDGDLDPSAWKRLFGQLAYQSPR